MTRFLALIALMWLLPAPGSAQITAPALARPFAPAFDPAAAYVTPGQDEPGYRAWYAAAAWRPVYVRAFNQYLTTYGVGGIAPTWQLLRTASDWQKCAADPFEIPPTSEWPNIVATLRFIRDRIVPVMGPVEPVSVYRNPGLNACAGGAATSTHREMGAVDLVPLRPITREALMSGMCAIHHAARSNVGLGFYKGLRFHVDSRKYRDWGTAGALGGYGCAAVLAEGAAPFVPEPVAPPALARPATGIQIPMPAQH
jgi:hypothetical protein